MADNTIPFVNEAQEATRSVYDAIQGLAGVQVNILHRLAQVQQDVFKQAFEATNDQWQLISQVRDPREFASAQADLAKRYGQRYVDSVKKAFDVIVEGWQEYGDRLETSARTVTGKAQRAARKTA
jgi:phasin family protein